MLKRGFVNPGLTLHGHGFLVERDGCASHKGTLSHTSAFLCLREVHCLGKRGGRCLTFSQLGAGGWVLVSFRMPSSNKLAFQSATPAHSLWQFSGLAAVVMHNYRKGQGGMQPKNHIVVYPISGLSKGKQKENRGVRGG